MGGLNLMHMGKARHFKTFQQATYQKINFSFYSLNISQNIRYIIGTFVQILYKIKTCTIKGNNVISMFLTVNGLDTLQYSRYEGFSK